MEVSFKTDQYSTSIAGFVRHLLFTIKRSRVPIFILKKTTKKSIQNPQGPNLGHIYTKQTHKP